MLQVKNFSPCYTYKKFTRIQLILNQFTKNPTTNEFGLKFYNFIDINQRNYVLC